MQATVLVRPEARPEAAAVGAASKLRLGIVIPVYQEAGTLAGSLQHLQRIARGCDVIVVDGASTDASAHIARSHFRTLQHSRPNRGEQLNLGACELDAGILLFLHADTRLPEGFRARIEEALCDPAATAGCFRLCFDRPSPWLWFYSFWTRFRGRYLHFGDQAFYVRREVFEALGGFAELPFMEDVDFLRRLRRHQRRRGQRFVVLSEPVVTSARRYRRYGAVRQQLLNIVLVTLFELGVPVRWLRRAYPPAR